MTDKAEGATLAGARSRILRLFDVVSSRKICDIVLFVVVTIWLFYRLISKTCFGTFFVESQIVTPFFIQHRVLLLCVFCELCCIWRGDYSRRDAAALAILGIASFGLLIHGYYDPLYDAIVVFSARRVGFRRLLAFSTVVVSILAIVVIVSSLIGVIPDMVLEQSGGRQARHCLGFTYCLYPAQYLFAVTCSVCILRDRKMHWAGIVALAVLNIVCFALSGSRLSFGLALLALALVSLRKLPVSDAFWKKLARVASWAFVGVIAISIIAVALWAIQVATGADLMTFANKLSANRISLSYKGLVNMGTGLFGQNVQWVGAGLDAYGNKATGTYNYVDNLFFHSLIEFGWVYTIALFALYTLAARKMVREGLFFAAVIYGVLALHFILDDLCLMLDFNVLLFALGPYLFMRAGESSGLDSK